MASQFEIDRLAKTEALIELYEDAVTALMADNTLQYTLDTGQTRTTVTKVDVVRLTDMLDRLYSRYDIYYARVVGTAASIVRPVW